MGEDSDVKDLTSETLKDQADIVTTKTDKSQVMQWGDLSFQTDKVSEFHRFLEILYPGDSDKHHAMRHGTSSADNRDCEAATREAFVQHGKFDAYTGFALQFQRIIVEACAEQAQGMNTDLVAAAKQACTSSVIV